MVNGVMLVSAINRLQQAGESTYDAVIEDRARGCARC